MIDIVLEMHWSNNPIPLNQLIDKPDVIFDIPLGLFTSLDSPVKSVNGKSGEVVLNAGDVGAEPVGTVQQAVNELETKKLNVSDYNILFLGVYDDYYELLDAYPIASSGQYAYVDFGLDSDLIVFAWKESESRWSAINSIDISNLGDLVRNTALTGLPTLAASPVLSTDVLLNAIAKLQAQADANKWNWVEVDTVGNWGQWIQPYYETGGTGGIQVCKKDGALWVRGMIRVVETSSSFNNQLIMITDPSYFLDIDRALTAYPTLNWIAKGVTYGTFNNFRWKRNQNFGMFLCCTSQITPGGIYMLPPICIGMLG